MREQTRTVTIPGDLYPTNEELADYAIYYAREELFEDYVLPANWFAHLIKGEVGDNEVVFEVTRISN